MLTPSPDIQGTGAVILAGAIRAFQITGLPLRDQRILFFGAGSSGVGVAETITKYFEAQGIPEQQAKDMFWLVDSKVRTRTITSLADGDAGSRCAQPW